MLSYQCFQVSQEFMKMINNPCRFLCPHKTSNCATNIFMFYRQMSKLKVDTLSALYLYIDTTCA